MYGEVEYDPLMDAFRCKICGDWFKGLGYHIYNKHGITVDEYKRKFGLEKNTSLLAKEYRQQRAELVKETGTIENLKAGKDTRFKKGDDPRRHYQRKPKTLRKLEKARSKAIKSNKK